MKFRIAQITDLHLDEAFPKEHGVETRRRLKTVLKDINLHGISEVVCTGDIGENDAVAYFFDQFKDYSLALTLGNHDDYITISKYHSRGEHPETSKLYSSILKAEFKFIFLDSSSGTIDNRQLVWLRNELDTVKTIVVFSHHPIIGLSLMVDEIGKLENRSEVLALLEGSNKQIIIFCGHYHMIDHQTHRNISQYITPAVSFQIEKKTDAIVIDSVTFGYRVLTFDEGHISSVVQTFHAK
ncbi:metallophosphoesterase [Roseivirga sp. E12]|uniref:metallophosphoesterase family protein n=1 Tax=Roseivirga sp. E12 TaxID=2819237 RepID=UPI001ABCC459|nr:metallophosphoesterase [Roseivirga sp. E12]MBO3696877.1 metallophosphoesterase [Roseivirga sp. E12]